jgi:hypothetical protein
LKPGRGIVQVFPPAAETNKREESIMRNQLLFCVIATGICVSPIFAERRPELLASESAPAERPARKTLWLASVTALSAANIVDIHSSWGKRELNQHLAGPGGSFGREGALIKLGVLGGVGALQYLVLHRRPSAKLYRKLAFINFGNASVTGAVAIRNYGIPAR